MKKYGKIIIVVVGVIIIIVLIFLIYLKTAFISKGDVENIVVSNMNASASDVYFESIDFELDKSVYEVEVYYQNREYEYKIDAKEGKIIYTNFSLINENITTGNSDNSNTNSNSNIDSNNSSNSSSNNISLEEAKNIALQEANLTEDNVQFLKTKTEYEDGTLVYEIDFTYEKFEYDYKINAVTGEIISYDKDSIYD